MYYFVESRKGFGIHSKKNTKTLENLGGDRWPLHILRIILMPLKKIAEDVYKQQNSS